MIMAEITTIDNLDLEEEDYGIQLQPNHEDEPELEVGEMPQQNQEPEQEEEPEDIIDSYLKYIGINDKSKISFEDEQGYSQKDWKDLSFEEKLNILKTSSGSPERDLTDEEINLINDIRRRNLTPADYIRGIQQATIQGVQQQNPQYSVDDLTDDEIFILDLQDRIPDISDEDVQTALDKAKENDSLFNRQVAGIRNELKQQEENYLKEQEFKQQQQVQENYQQFANSVNDSLTQFNKIGSLDLNLDDNDRDNIMSFILDVDDTGMSTLGKTLNDPNMLVRLSWFALYGQQAFDTIQNYFAQEISKANTSGYQRGLADGRKGTSKVVYTKNQTRSVNSIDDLYG